jgi:hypothetical protein
MHALEYHDVTRQSFDDIKLAPLDIILEHAKGSDQS